MGVPRRLLSYLPLLRDKPLLATRLVKGVVARRFLGRHPLRNIEIQVTAACNSDCVMCFSTKLRNDGARLLAPAEIASFWDECLELGALCAVVTGGEPFMRKDLYEIVAALRPDSTIIGLLTNCLTVSEDSIRTLKQLRVDYLQLSLDGLTEAENDRVRGARGHYRKVMEVVAYARKHGLQTSISFTVSHETIPRLGEMLRFVRERGLYFIPSPAVPVGNWAGGETALLTADDWKHLGALARRYPEVRACYSLNYLGKSQCPSGQEKFCLGPYGDVMGCSLNHVSFGNVRKEPLRAIWARMLSFEPLQTPYPYCRVAGDLDYIERVTRELNKHDRFPVPYADLPSGSRPRQ